MVEHGTPEPGPDPTPTPNPDNNGGGSHGGHGGGSSSGSKKSSTTTASGPAAQPTEPVTVDANALSGCTGRRTSEDRRYGSDGCADGSAGNWNNWQQLMY